MRVLLDTSFALRGPTGTGVYVEQLRAALAEAGADVVEARDTARAAPAGGGAGSVRNLLRDLRWRGAELPHRAREAGADVIHHPLPGLIRSVRGIGQVVTVHDLAFVRHPELYDDGYRRFAVLAHRLAARRAEAVVAVSATTATDLRARWGVPADRIVVARHGPGQALPVVAARAPEHLLYVGDDQPRKGLPRLLAAYAQYRAKVAEPLSLVLSGAIAAEIDAAGVRVERDVSPPRLAELLAGAALLVHPAVHEGAGLTLTEAMAAGVPVLAVRSPGVVETCGDAAELVAPEAFAPALAALAADEGRRAALAVRGRERAATLSWKASAQAHLRAYALAVR